MLVQATSSPDFVNYLTFLFCTPQPPPSIGFNIETYNVIRVSAAMNLKTKLRVAYSTISPNSLAYIQSSAWVALQDPAPQVRASAGTIITEIVKQGGLLVWPNLLEDLLSLAANSTGSISVPTQEAAMSALSKVCEDNRKLLDKEFQGQRPMNIIIPKLMDLTASRSPKIRATVLATVLTFMSQRPQALISSLDRFLAELFRLANDPSTDVRRRVCQAFVQLVDIAPEKLVPHMDGLVNYVLLQQHNPEDPELALDAAEFWLVVGAQKQLQDPLVPHLGRIIPILLQSMIYEEDDALVLAGEADDADDEDRAEDLKPQFAKSKGTRLPVGKTGDGQLNGDDGAQLMSDGGAGDGGLSDGEIDDGSSDEFGDDDPEGEWTLRKCSAAALDVFANVYHRRVFEIILPYLKDNLRHTQWANREAAVLALGAIADGCMDSVTPHLPELIPYLISLLADPEPVVRKITCWCLGRYSEWASHLDPPEKALYFEPMMEGILHRMLDNNKKVQEAAASAFANLEVKSEANLIPYCQPILRQFVQCFEKYKDRNMYVLYDCVQTLAECVMSELAKPELVEILMPALIQRWNKVSDQSREVFPLLECLGYVAAAYGDTFSPFAPAIFARCTKIIYNNLQEYIAAVNYNTGDQPDKDFLVTSLDLLSAIIQAIDAQRSGELVASSQPRFFDLLCFCMEDLNCEVRLSSYALLGDCAIYVFPHLQPFLPNIMPILIKQLDLDLIRDDDSENGLSVINNACWSCGEIAVNATGAMSPYLESLYQAFIVIMSNEEVPDTVNENAAMAVGRLGIGCSDLLAPHLAEFAEPFLRSMAKIDFTREKASAFLGFNQIVKKNPKAMEGCLAEYFHAIAIFPSKSLSQEEYRELQQSFQQVCSTLDFPSYICTMADINIEKFQVLQGYKDLIPDFNSFLSTLPVPVSRKLQATYHL
jgi:HEAT repeat protein